VGLYHGGDAVGQAEGRYHAIASGGSPEDMETVAVDGNGVSIIELLKLAGFAASNSDARRLISGGGVKLDNDKVNDVNLTVRQDCVLSRGKNKFVQVRIG